MKSSTAKALVIGIVTGFLASATLAVEIPLSNWTVPPYSPAAASGGISTMADITPAIAFVGMTPCRLVDTRQAGFPATYGTPSLAAGVPRNFDLNNQPNCTGIPAGVEAYSLNFTVTNTLGPGFLKVFPQGGADPGDISTINYVAGQTIANAAIVPAGTGAGITVIAGVSGTNVIIDINGYFSDTLNPGIPFVAVSSVDGEAAILGQNNSNVSGSHAIGGFVNGTGQVYGVQGQIGGSVGAGSAAVHGLAQTSGTNAVYGGEFESSSTAAFSAGAIGDGDTATGENYGVFGDNDSTTDCAAGVFGRSGAQIPCPLNGSIGVLGTNTNIFAVAGRSSNLNGRGVNGQRSDAAGTSQTTGVLGYAGNSGVHSFNDITKVGNVTFVEPHPNDASKQITYASLEGREVGTYFRGKAKFERGVATIEVPEDFRMVTESEGLSIQVTPIGEMATYAVLSIGLDRILVKGSRNVEFFYTVNGIRAGNAGFEPVAKNIHFVPLSAADDMLEHMPATREKLMKNGVLGPDGKVSAETARRLGWDQVWDKEQIRIQAEEAADREADRQGVAEGTIKAQLPE